MNTLFALSSRRLLWCAFFSQVQFTNWGSGQPNNMNSASHGNGQDCVEIGSSFTAASKWNDADCNDTSKFICEKSGAKLSGNSLGRLKHMELCHRLV